MRTNQVTHPSHSSESLICHPSLWSELLIRVADPTRSSESVIRVADPSRSSESVIRVADPSRRSESVIRVGHPSRRTKSVIRVGDPSLTDCQGTVMTLAPHAPLRSSRNTTRTRSAAITLRFRVLEIRNSRSYRNESCTQLENPREYTARTRSAAITLRSRAGAPSPRAHSAQSGARTLGRPLACE